LVALAEAFFVGPLGETFFATFLATFLATLVATLLVALAEDFLTTFLATFTVALLVALAAALAGLTGFFFFAGFALDGEAFFAAGFFAAGFFAAGFLAVLVKIVIDKAWQRIYAQNTKRAVIWLILSLLGEQKQILQNI
jgi:hypothetical protein